MDEPAPGKWGDPEAGFPPCGPAQFVGVVVVVVVAGCVVSCVVVVVVAGCVVVIVVAGAGGGFTVVWEQADRRATAAAARQVVISFFMGFLLGFEVPAFSVAGQESVPDSGAFVGAFSPPLRTMSLPVPSVCS
jgi:hypothetical protein